MLSFQYDWLEFQGRPLEDRFPDGSVGHPQWVDLVKKVLGNPNDSEACHQAFDDFMAVLAPGEPVLPPQKDCRVFVSHRRGPPDENHAEQIAWHATEHKYDYWLDVHDPILKRLDGSQVPSPAYEVLVAGVIEIALLNCSHIIAVITQDTAPSKWIPYEFGRAKLRVMISKNSSIWLDTGMTEADCGEYVYLSPAHKSMNELESWLQQNKVNSACVSLSDIEWPKSRRRNPYPLPN